MSDTLFRYVVYRSRARESDVLGWIEVEEEPELLATLDKAKERAQAALNLDRSYLVFWEGASEEQRRLAEERGDVTKQEGK